MDRIAEGNFRKRQIKRLTYLEIIKPVAAVNRGLRLRDAFQMIILNCGFKASFLHAAATSAVKFHAKQKQTNHKQFYC